MPIYQQTAPFNNWVAGWAEGYGAEVVPQLPDGAHLPVDPALPPPGTRGHARQNWPRFRDQQGNPDTVFMQKNLLWKGLSHEMDLDDMHGYINREKYTFFFIKSLEQLRAIHSFCCPR